MVHRFLSTAEPQPNGMPTAGKPFLIKPTSAPRRGRHITAQGRDRRSRTLGNRPPSLPTPLGHAVRDSRKAFLKVLPPLPRIQR